MEEQERSTAEQRAIDVQDSVIAGIEYVLTKGVLQETLDLYDEHFKEVLQGRSLLVMMCLASIIAANSILQWPPVDFGDKTEIGGTLLSQLTTILVSFGMVGLDETKNQ